MCGGFWFGSSAPPSGYREDVPFDTAPLTREPTAEEVADLRRRERQGEFGPHRFGPAWLGVLVFVAMFAVIGVVAWTFVVPVALGRGPISGFMLLWLGGMALSAVTGTAALVRGVRRRLDWARLALFARANGLQFHRFSSRPNYPGMLFSLGGDRSAIDHVWSPSGALADAGTYSYTTGSGEDRSTQTWSFVAYRLPRPLPHLVLDARANDPAAGSNLPVAYRRDQRVSLGEPFDSSFTVYAPDGYGQDTFQLLPPDLMERLLQTPAAFDIEIVDDWLFLYARRVDFTDPDVWRSIQWIGDAVVGRIAEVAGRYTDDRALAFASTALGGGHPGVPAIAEQGRRLRRSWVRAAISIGIFVTMAVIWYLLRYSWLP